MAATLMLGGLALGWGALGWATLEGEPAPTVVKGYASSTSGPAKSASSSSGPKFSARSEAS